MIARMIIIPQRMKIKSFLITSKRNIIEVVTRDPQEILN